MNELILLTVLCWVFLNDTRAIFAVQATLGFYLGHDIYAWLSVAMLVFIVHMINQSEQIEKSKVK